MSEAIRLLIVDDHQVVREGIKRILLAEQVVTEVGEAKDGQEALEKIRAGQWSAVILDLGMPGRNGLDVLTDIKAEFPQLPVLILSSYPEDQFAVRVVRNGASGYVNKATLLHVLVAAVKQVLAGKRYISPEVAAQLFESIGRPQQGPLHTTLSNREDQVLRALGAGRAVGEVAVQLQLSAKTVSTYRANILRKLNLRNTAQIIRYAHEHGLVE